MIEYYVPVLAVVISIIAATISYLNYRLNKTLFIKNQLFNEKLKKYIELSRNIAEFIELMDVIGPKIDGYCSGKVGKDVLLDLATKIDGAGLNIGHLIIESYMLVPEHIINRMTEFAEMQNLGLPYDLTKTTTAIYWKHDTLIRKKAENLIMAFRSDLGVDKLSMKFNPIKAESISI